MSIQFSNTTSKGGLIQIIERNCGLNDGDISGNATRLAQFTSDINQAQSHAWDIIFSAGGTWQWDDSNQIDHPFIKTDIVSGQRDYSFNTDGSGNLVLDIYKVLVADSTGTFMELNPVDQQSYAPSNYQDGLNVQGQPTSYDKTGNSIFLDAIPNYNREDGLKVLVNREGVSFAVSDTTKKAGFSGLFHEYLALRPSYFYCVRHKMNDLAKTYKNEMLEMEEKMREHYSKREKDVVKRLTGRINKYK